MLEDPSKFDGRLSQLCIEIFQDISPAQMTRIRSLDPRVLIVSFNLIIEFNKFLSLIISYHGRENTFLPFTYY